METRRQQRTIKIMVNNVNGGLRAEPDPKKWDDICEWIEQRQPDIVMLQETKLNQIDEKKIKIPAGYEMIAAGLKKERMRGVMTLVSQELAMGIRKEKIIRGEDGRYLMVPIATLTPGQMMWIVNIYAPVAEEVW